MSSDNKLIYLKAKQMEDKELINIIDILKTVDSGKESNKLNMFLKILNYKMISYANL